MFFCEKIILFKAAVLSTSAVTLSLNATLIQYFIIDFYIITVFIWFYFIISELVPLELTPEQPSTLLSRLNMIIPVTSGILCTLALSVCACVMFKRRYVIIIHPFLLKYIFYLI